MINNKPITDEEKQHMTGLRSTLTARAWRAWSDTPITEVPRWLIDALAAQREINGRSLIG